MKVSIIIPTYNRGKYIGITLQSFLELNYPKNRYEIIVVNNNSTDNTEEVIQQYINNSFGVKLHYLFEPRQGVHYARNTAARMAKFELLYFTDDDMIADTELLNEIIKPFQFDSKVADVTGKVLPKWEEEPPKWILKHCNNYLLSLLNPDYDFIIADSIRFLYSCHQAIRREVFFQVEGFNPEYTKGKYMGDGETGLNIKVRKLGYKFGYNGKSVIFHIIPKSRCSQAYLNRRFENNGRAHAYTSFRERGSIFYLVMSICKNLICRFPMDIIITIIKPIFKKDFSLYLSLYRLLIGRLYYLYGNMAFNFNLLTKSNFRKFVLKNDWLSYDKEFDAIKL
ncbi:MAG: glycosyltransferase [Bacteroidia bacterium]|nr:glycosyltransferase [Bacteroidia bacterium]